jgi:hypothetical protein
MKVLKCNFALLLSNTHNSPLLWKGAELDALGGVGRLEATSWLMVRNRKRELGATRQACQPCTVLRNLTNALRALELASPWKPVLIQGIPGDKCKL